MIALFAAVGIFLFVPETSKSSLSPHSDSTVVRVCTEQFEEEDIGWSEKKMMLSMTVYEPSSSLVSTSHSAYRIITPANDEQTPLEIKESEVSGQTNIELESGSGSGLVSRLHHLEICSEDQAVDGDNNHKKITPHSDEETLLNDDHSSKINITPQFNQPLPSTFLEILQTPSQQFLLVLYMFYCFLILYIDER